MLQRNELWVGLFIGILLPLAGFTILYQLFGLLEARGAASGAGFSPNFRERTLAIVAIAFNILPMNVYQKRRWDKAMRGIVMATAALALFWLFRFGLKMF
jgi:hypothetical protein